MKIENKNLEKPKRLKERRLFLTMRMKNTNLAIFFCTATGLMIALVIVLMFASAMLSYNSAILISSLFILAMLSLIISLLLFLREIFYTTSFIKKKKDLLK